MSKDKLNSHWKQGITNLVVPYLWAVGPQGGVWATLILVAALPGPPLPWSVCTLGPQHPHSGLRLEPSHPVGSSIALEVVRQLSDYFFLLTLLF